jgi:RNA polymerase sigma-70 factor (sigma-E family)
MRAAEEAEFREWATARQAALRRTAYLLCGDWHRAEDLVQETLTKMYRRWPQLARRDAVESYARRVLTNSHIDERRRRSSHEVSIAVLPGHDGGDAVDGDLDERAVLRLTLLAALERMPRSQRAVLVLRYWEDQTQAQTAEALGCSEGNVKSQASRGLTALRAELQRVGVELVTVPDDPGEEPPEGPDGASSRVRALREVGRRTVSGGAFELPGRTFELPGQAFRISPGLAFTWLFGAPDAVA